MKTALLLGAGSDVAKATARLLALDAWQLFLADRDKSIADTLARDLEIRGAPRAEGFLFDALDTPSHRAFYQSLPTPPDLVIVFFGYMADQAAAEQDFNLARKMIDINYTGAVSILEIVAADFSARRHGDIIAFSSCAGDRGRQSNYIYGSAKAALSAYLSGLRNRLARSNVHVMTVKPGFMRTAMTAHLQLPPALTASPEQAAKDTIKAFQRRKNVVYIRWMWRWIMLIVRSIPESIFKRLSM